MARTKATTRSHGQTEWADIGPLKSISGRFRFRNRKSYKSTYCCRLDKSEHKRHIPLKEGTSETQCSRQSFRVTS